MTKNVEFKKMTKAQLVDLLLFQPFVGCPDKGYLQKHTKKFLVNLAEWIEENAEWY